MTISKLTCSKGHVFRPKNSSNTHCPVCAKEDTSDPKDIGKVHKKSYCYRCDKITLHTLAGPYHDKYYWKCEHGCPGWKLAEMSKDVNLA